MEKIYKDSIAGLAVFLVAIPLCLGIALASGAPMAAGLMGGIIGGLIIGSISGSHVSVSGPAAGLATVVFSAITEIGSFEAFLVAVILAGVFQLIMALLKLGEIARFFPNSVIKGLLTSIGIVLILKQIPHAFGYDKDLEGDFVFLQTDQKNTFSEIFEGLNHLHPGSIIIAVLCILILVFWSKILPRKIHEIIPASLVVVAAAIFINEIIFVNIKELYVESTHTVALPEGISLANAGKLLTFPDFSAISHPIVWKIAFILAIVASLETLLNIEATDKLDPLGHKTPVNRELFAQGTGNLISGFLGGLPLTSVIVRSSVNINSGAKSKFSAIFHGAYILIFILIFPEWLSKISLSALAAILIVAGFKLISIKDFKTFYANGWNQFLPFIITILAILFTNLLTGVIIGLVAAVFFILRSNFKNPFIFIREEYQNRKILKLELSQQVSFFHKAALENTLDRVADNSNILIDGTRTDFLDQDIRDTLLTYKEFGVSDKNVNLSFVGFDKKYKIEDEIKFPYVLTKELLEKLTPDDVLAILKKGNMRFVNGSSQKKDLLRQVKESSTGQHPMSVILACIDSRSSTELIFDQGFGDIVSIRIAGNVVNEDILGSLEFACQVLGAKLIVVLGHTNCGAVKAAFEETPEGNIAPLINKIKKSMHVYLHHNKDDDKVTALSKENIFNSIDEIMSDSNLKPMIDSKQIKIVGAMYNIESGVVDFYD